MNTLKTLTAAAAFAVLGGASYAATANYVGPNPPEILANGGVYSQTLTPGDIVGVNVYTDTTETMSAVGFNVSPADAVKTLALSIDDLDQGLYGAITAYLSTTADMSGAFATGMTNGDGQLVLSSAMTSDPFYVVLDWAKKAQNNFSYDVTISAVPLPAGLLLLGSALAGLGIARRRKTVA